MKQRNYIFAPPKNPHIPKPKNFVGFDTETNDHEFLVGAYFGYTTTRKGRVVEIADVYDDLDEFKAGLSKIEEQFKRNRQVPTFVGFNTSYDLAYLQEQTNTAERLDAGSRFIISKTLNGNDIVDIANHVIGSLDDWITRLNMTEEYGICKREGYLDSDEGKKSQVLDDAAATYILANWVQDQQISKFGVGFKPTRFGTSLEIFRRNYFRGFWFRNSSEQWKNDFERSGYYGGRCEIFQRGTYCVESYDVNSMYVAIMRDADIPNPTKCKYLKDQREIMDKINAGEHLMVDVHIYQPIHNLVGLLPYRDPNNKKLLFPVGEWRGIYHSHELRAAMRHGLQILKIHRALWYPETDKYFSEFAQMTLDGRAEAKRNGDYATEQLYKYYGNGLYGKFAQRNGGSKKYVLFDQYDGPKDDIMVFADSNDNLWVEVDDDSLSDAVHCFPCVSATITALARVKLLDALVANDRAVVYCDTDSIKLVGSPHGITISKEPGDWDYEYTASQPFWAPKVYGDKRKGVPSRAKLVSRVDDIETYEFERPISFKESLRRGLPQNHWENKRKSIILRDTKRYWYEDGKSSPLIIKDGIILDNPRYYQHPDHIDTKPAPNPLMALQGVPIASYPLLR